MEAGRSNQVTKKTLSMKARVTLKVRVIVALVAVCLLAAPSTRAHKHDSESLNRTAQSMGVSQEVGGDDSPVASRAAG